MAGSNRHLDLVYCCGLLRGPMLGWYVEQVCCSDGGCYELMLKIRRTPVAEGELVSTRPLCQMSFNFLTL